MNEVRLAHIARVLSIDRADCESKRKTNCESCPQMAECAIALAIIDVNVLKEAALVDVGQAAGELLIAKTMLSSTDWERLAREHPELVEKTLIEAIRWRIENALKHLGAR